MKNNEEFRRLVYEKADTYKKKRAATIRKIGQTVTLCSLCVVIGASAFFGMRHFGNDIFHPNLSESLGDDPGNTTDNPQSLPAETTTVAHPTHTVSPTETGSQNLTTTAVPTMTTTAAMTTSCTPTIETTFITSTTSAAMSTTGIEDTTVTETTAFTETTSSSVETEQHDPAAVIKPMMILRTSKTDEEAEQLAYMSYNEFWNAFHARYETRLTGGEREHYMLTKTFDNDFFKKNMLVVVYVRTDLTAYSFTMEAHTVMSRFFDIEKSDIANGKMELHFYAVPWSYRTDQVLLSYGQ